MAGGLLLVFTPLVSAGWLNSVVFDGELSPPKQVHAVLSSVPEVVTM